jgi:hypothetical protein
MLWYLQSPEASWRFGDRNNNINDYDDGRRYPNSTGHDYLRRRYNREGEDDGYYVVKLEKP